MSMMYQAYQNHMDLTAPWRSGAAQALKYLNLVPQGVSDKLFGRLAAALELISRTSLTYTRPPYGIDKVLVGNQELGVTEEVVFATPFGSLLHFKKEHSPPQPWPTRSLCASTNAAAYPISAWAGRPLRAAIYRSERWAASVRRYWSLSFRWSCARPILSPFRTSG